MTVEHKPATEAPRGPSRVSENTEGQVSNVEIDPLESTVETPPAVSSNPNAKDESPSPAARTESRSEDEAAAAAENSAGSTHHAPTAAETAAVPTESVAKSLPQPTIEDDSDGADDLDDLDGLLGDSDPEDVPLEASTSAPDTANAPSTLDEALRQAALKGKGTESFDAAISKGMEKIKEGQTAPSAEENPLAGLLDLLGVDGDGDFLETLMNQLVSRDLMEEPFKELETNYASYLASDKAATLAPTELANCKEQYAIVQEVLEIYRTTNDTARVAELVAQISSLGRPPAEIMGENAGLFDSKMPDLGDLPDLDDADLKGLEGINMDDLAKQMSELSADDLPGECKTQ